MVAVYYSQDGQTLASASSDNTAKVRLLRASDGVLLYRFDQETEGAVDVVYSPTGGTFAFSRYDATLAIANLPPICYTDLNLDGFTDLSGGFSSPYT